MSTKQHVSPALEEYLEQIYRLEKEHGVARTKHLAQMVGVSLGTVTNTIEVLKQRNLITHVPYKGAKLTEAGQRIAIDVLRRHRLAERLLTDFLKIEWNKVHDHACELEHTITDDLIFPLEKALGHPQTCPHGNPIPTMRGKMPEEQSQPLVDLNEGDKGVVVKIVKENQPLLEYLSSIALVPGTPIEVMEKAPFEGPITVTIYDQKRPISWKIASIVWVTKRGID